MSIQIMIGGIRIRFESEVEIQMEENFRPFCWTDEKDCDITITVICEEHEIQRPEGTMSGEDLLLECYHQGNQTICLAKGGVDGYLSKTICDAEFENLECRVHTRAKGLMHSLASILRLIPMCSILQKHQVLFLHASQIAVNGKGILFTAPSGTGKTTQARLWEAHRDAAVVCNDRTLIGDGKTYGYPIDGSEPVRSEVVFPLGAIVVLEQCAVNEIRRLSFREAVIKLMPQIVMSVWDTETRMWAMDQILSYVEKYPVYLLGCTPDEDAVKCLEQQLEMDGVISYG